VWNHASTPTQSLEGRTGDIFSLYDIVYTLLTIILFLSIVLALARIQWTRQFRVIDSSESPSHKYFCFSRILKYTDSGGSRIWLRGGEGGRGLCQQGEGAPLPLDPLVTDSLFIQPFCPNLLAAFLLLVVKFWLLSTDDVITKRLTDRYHGKWKYQ